MSNNNNNSLREEIERRLASNQVYYAHFVSDGEPMRKIREDTANDILKIIEKRINKVFNHYGACQSALDEVRELLK